MGESEPSRQPSKPPPNTNSMYTRAAPRLSISKQRLPIRLCVHPPIMAGLKSPRPRDRQISATASQRAQLVRELPILQPFAVLPQVVPELPPNMREAPVPALRRRQPKLTLRVRRQHRARQPNDVPPPLQLQDRRPPDKPPRRERRVRPLNPGRRWRVPHSMRRPVRHPVQRRRSMRHQRSMPPRLNMLDLGNRSITERDLGPTLGHRARPNREI